MTETLACLIAGHWVMPTAMGEASHVYSISLFTFHTKVSIHTASLEIVRAHRVRPETGLMALRKHHLVVYWPVLGTVSAPGRPVSDVDASVR